MFCWFKKRYVFEHKKLIYLNKVSTSDQVLEALLAEKGFHAEVDFLIGLRELANEMDHLGVPKDGLPNELVDLGLQINKVMLSLFCLGYDLPMRKFEKFYMPIGGWQQYLGK